MSDESIRAYLKLTLAQGVGAITFHRIVEAFSSVEAAACAPVKQLLRVQGVGDKTAQAITSVTEDQIDDEIAEARKLGAEIICDCDESYPAALKTIYGRPPLLYVRGKLEPTDAVALGVVGSRRCTHYGLEQGQRFGELLGRAGFTVVSGGARGIDTAAHRGALSAGGRTIAVMGCGLCHSYPSENEKLFEQICSDDNGAVISEFPMRTAVLAGNFPTRNRIISGLSLGVLIVEAAKRSGALITATEAAEHGREVFAIPGRVDSPLSAGSNELIRDGAILTQNLEDILEHLGQVGVKMTEEEQSGEDVLPAGLNELEQRIIDALKENPLSVDEIVRQCSLDSGKVASTMTMLVLKGAVTQQPGNVFARKSLPNAAD